MNQVRVRFAPSPTGYLHIGGLRAAFFNWLFAKHNNGKFLIRIEDTDVERSKPEYTNDFLDSFKWISIESDEPIVIQSKFIELHRKIACQLLETGKAYKCFCAPEKSEQASEIPEIHIKSSDPCINTKHEQQNNRDFVVKFKIPQDIDFIEFDDLIRGAVRFERDQLADFIILRSDGTPTYNFAVVVDDANMNISHVLRGEEHISNTPKQILIYQACQYKLPKFGHLPLILNPDGSKLSKRDTSTFTTVREYRQNGFLADALCNYLVRLGWSHGDQEIFTREELIKYFSIEQVGKKGAIFDIKKLEWINGVYIRNTPANKLLEFIISDVKPDFLEQISKWPKENILKIIDLYKDRVKTLKELAEEIIELYKGPKKFDENEIKDYLNQKTLDSINSVISIIKNQKELDPEKLSIEIKNLCKKTNMKLPEVAKPIRMALTGKTSSPGIFELMAALSPDDNLNRLLYFIKYVESRK